jgi:hypothetical protein
MQFIRFLAISLAACAASALAGGLEDAKALLDKAAPADCELLMMHYEANSMPLSSEERNGVVEQMKRRLIERDRDNAADHIAFDSALLTLTQPERAELERHAMKLYSDCAARAEAIYHFHLPLVPKGASKQLETTPHAPTQEKSAPPSVELPAAPKSPSVDR